MGGGLGVYSCQIIFQICDFLVAQKDFRFQKYLTFIRRLLPLEFASPTNVKIVPWSLKWISGNKQSYL